MNVLKNISSTVIILNQFGFKNKLKNFSLICCDENKELSQQICLYKKTIVLRWTVKPKKAVKESKILLKTSTCLCNNGTPINFISKRDDERSG